ncbi:cellulose 1,4-beta-cellobiosidase [Fusarium austroafricanum]|uniref:Glucanase n=1 Tax=Fusarium austroafricanum TaxID=2364996 RepID=A0A8H4NJV0_9HYPO|nr:cellulose 1,4-beta-cellobiosidase [Fusarium austroafricanum]
MLRYISLATALIASTSAQWACPNSTEVHAPLRWHKCRHDLIAENPECKDTFAAVVLDANLRRVNCCGTSSNVQRTSCKKLKKGETGCPVDCCIAGANYTAHGVFTHGDELTLDFAAKSPNTPDYIRVFLLAHGDQYERFNFLAPWESEISIDVDVSKLGKGFKAVVSLHRMKIDGGKKRYKGDKVGARYGTGYCDATCPRDQKFVGGKANYDHWVPSETDPFSGSGYLGYCCPHAVVWEGNKYFDTFSFHQCAKRFPHTCYGNDCGMKCHSRGCDYNPMGKGNSSFYGPGPEHTVDTNKKFTVGIRWHSGSPRAQFKSMTRGYAQDGKVIKNTPSDFQPENKWMGITQEYCKAYHKVFGTLEDFHAKAWPFWRMQDSHWFNMVLAFSLVKDKDFNHTISAEKALKNSKITISKLNRKYQNPMWDDEEHFLESQKKGS